MPAAIPRKAILLLVILTIVWGTNWPLFPLAVREVSVLTFRAISMLGAGCALLIVARLRGQSLDVPRRYWRTIMLASFCYLVVWNIASTYSAVTIASGQSAVLGFTMPLWAALISWAFLNEKLTPRLLLAIGLGGLAVFALMGQGLTRYADAPLGFAAGLIAGIGWAAGTLILKRGQVRVSALVLTGWQLLVAGVPIAVVSLIMADGPWFLPDWQSIAVIAWITLVPMSIGNAAWFSIVGMLPANIAGLSVIMTPVVAMLSGAWVHGEPLGPLQWLAMVCSVCALSLVLLTPAVPASPQSRRQSVDR